MYDAIVVGAGLSGLTCARRLVDGGAQILVLEARERVGGRLHSGKVGGAVVDLGGQWVTAGQPRVAALAVEAGVDVEHHDRSGRALLADRGGWFAAYAQRRAMREIERMMGAPEPTYDQRSLADHLGEIRNRVARERIGLHADLVFAADPAGLSLLYYLATMRATGGFRPESPDEYRFAGGAQLLASRLAERVGDRIRLGEPVTAIEQSVDRVAVTAASVYEAKRVVLAIPPALVRRIAVDLPRPVQRYVEASSGGPVVKCFAAYDRPVWRERGCSGESYHPRGTVRATVEIAGEAHVLLAFVVGREAARWSSRTPEERRADVTAVFAEVCGEPATPIDYLEADWGAESWSAGCVPGLRPGALSAGARWREPHGRLHIAGTESATKWPGYMEGAIDAGERAASEVLAAL